MTEETWERVEADETAGWEEEDYPSTSSESEDDSGGERGESVARSAVRGGAREAEERAALSRL